MTVKLIGSSPVSKDDISALGNALHSELPKDYVDFLISHNGAKPESNIFRISKNTSCGVDRFIPLKEVVKELANIDHVSKHMIPIAWAEGGNYVLQNLTNGRIFFWDHELPEEQIELALGVAEFVEGLEPFDVNSIELKEGQVKSAWIDPDFLKNL